MRWESIGTARPRDATISSTSAVVFDGSLRLPDTATTLSVLVMTPWSPVSPNPAREVTNCEPARLPVAPRKSTVETWMSWCRRCRTTRARGRSSTTSPATTTNGTDSTTECRRRSSFAATRPSSSPPRTAERFLLLIRDGIVVAGGAFKRVSAEVAEIKRVWTNPAFRRQGLARVVMAALESAAADAGYTVAELTTGARQPEAVALYLALGYRPALRPRRRPRGDRLPDLLEAARRGPGA